MILYRTIKQKNEPGLEFSWDEDKLGNIILEVKIAKFLDNSLIDVDIHPNFVSIIVKGKVLRLAIPDEIKVSESKCQRAKLTGILKLTMPKVNGKHSSLFLSAQNSNNKATKKDDSSRVKRIEKKNKLSLQEQMLQDAMQAASLTDAALENSASKSIDISNIVSKPKNKEDENVKIEVPVSRHQGIHEISQ